MYSIIIVRQRRNLLPEQIRNRRFCIDTFGVILLCLNYLSQAHNDGHGGNCV
jgi:hypothetical protein